MKFQQIRANITVELISVSARQRFISNHSREDVDPKIKNYRNRTLLSKAAGNGRLDIVESLFARGVDFNSKNIENQTPLSWAVKRDNFEMTK